MTHDVDEALLIGQELVLLKPGEAPVKRRLDEAYPRHLEGARLQALKTDILEILR